MKACFMGLGYIGLPTAIIAAKHGIQITGVDINPHVVEMTNAGHLHIIEPGMEKMLQEVVKTGMLKASVTPEVSDAYFMVVPTPFKGNHEPDVSYVEAASSTSCVSIPILVKILESSLTKAMFISRCEFSITLAASATLIVEARWVPAVMTDA